MLVDKLRLSIAAQQHAKIVKPGDHALQLYTVDQENGYRNLGLPNLIEKSILQILFIGGHWLIVLVFRRATRIRLSTQPDSPSIARRAGRFQSKNSIFADLIRVFLQGFRQLGARVAYRRRFSGSKIARIANASSRPTTMATPKTTCTGPLCPP
jgi:hypothetical protein